MNFIVMPRVRLALIIGLTALTTGCETIPTVVEGRSYTERADILRATEYWQMRGRIAVDTGDDAWQARFNWWQDADTLRLQIRGPLNIGAVEVSGSPQTLTLRKGRDTWVLEDPEIQLSEVLGWWVPVTSLQSWLIGIPDDSHTDNRVVSPDELLVYLLQRDWELNYDDYSAQDEIMIPARIRLSHAPIEIIVTVDNWTTERPIRRQTLN